MPTRRGPPSPSRATGRSTCREAAATEGSRAEFLHGVQSSGRVWYLGHPVALRPGRHRDEERGLRRRDDPGEHRLPAVSRQAVGFGRYGSASPRQDATGEASGRLWRQEARPLGTVGNWCIRSGCPGLHGGVAGDRTTGGGADGAAAGTLSGEPLRRAAAPHRGERRHLARLPGRGRTLSPADISAPGGAATGTCRTAVRSRSMGPATTG